MIYIVKLLTNDWYVLDTLICEEDLTYIVVKCQQFSLFYQYNFI